MKKIQILKLVIGFLFIIGGLRSFVEVDQGELVVIKRGNVPVRQLTTPGIHLKWFYETTVVLNKKLHIMDFDPQSIGSSDDKRFVVDYFAHWTIVDGIKYTLSLGANQSTAEAQLTRNVTAEVNNRLAKNPFKETLTTERDSLMNEAANAANKTVEEQFGIHVAKIRMNKIDLPESSRESTYELMRQNIQKDKTEMLSSGRAEATKKIAEAEKTRDQKISGAQLEAAQTRASGIKKASDIRRTAYGSNMAFYNWYREWISMQRVCYSSRPENILENGGEEHNKVYKNN